MRQCFQLADSSAAKLKRGRIKMQVAGHMRPKFGRILPERAEKARILKIFSFLYFFDMIKMKPVIFTDFCTSMASKFIVIKW